jgi:CheY-like chemotaxis protein
MKRILVVDDDHATVATLCDILGLHGWETVRGHDREAAARIRGSEGMDLVLMDVIMPRMNGVEALREIRTRQPNARVILSLLEEAGS